MLNLLKDHLNVAFTENGARARATTNSKLVDFFSQGGAIRHQNEKYILDMFRQSFGEDRLSTIKTAFYFRDVRGGQGQRRPFRVQLKYMADNYPQYVKKLIPLVPEYGRFDDLFVLIGTQLESEVLNFIKTTFVNDLKNLQNSEGVSLAAKWLPSPNTSSRQTRQLAKKIYTWLGLTEKQYRKSLSSLRKHLNIIERNLSSKEYNLIDYSKVPSNAMSLYRKSFYRNDITRFENYLSKVEKGEAKINSSVLYPYQLVEKAYGSNDRVVEEQWKALPNYCGDVEENSICVVDVSGSMTWSKNPRPIDVAVSLGLYTAERAKGPYKDHFITFSDNPQMQKLNGRTLHERVRNMCRADWCGSTNIKSVFRLILDVAVKNNLPQSELIQKVYIISDMEFNGAMSGRPNKTLFQQIAQLYQAHGYEMPFLVFWNVNARNVQFPMSMDDRGFLNVSGFSPSIFKNLMSGKFSSPMSLVADVINSERYDAIENALADEK